MGSCAAPSAKGDDKFITTDYLQQCPRERTALTSASPEALSAHLPLLENQASSVWSMGKDGRSYWPVKRQAATADRIANHKGRNPQERASLKKRLLTL
ncbi:MULTISPECIES: hypothetical protein, partial [Klebsiella]|uniref:hypothetical protein n=1 Tax=Klebsiella TaxID=570 RepID=UPI0003701E64